MSRSIIIDLVEKFAYTHVSRFFRNAGKKLYYYGANMANSNDEVVPSLRNLSYNSKSPEFEKASFIAPNSVISGEVTIGKGSAIYYGIIIRAYNNRKVIIGDNVIINDLTVIYAEDSDVIIEDNSIIGANCYIKDSKISKNSVLGHNSKISNSSLKEEIFVGAGSTIDNTSSLNSKKNEIYIGDITNSSNPLRELNLEEIESLSDIRAEQSELSKVHDEANFINIHEIIDKKDYDEFIENAEDEEIIERKLTEINMQTTEYDDEYAELRHDMEADLDGFEYDREFVFYDNTKKFPKAFEIYQKNFEKYNQPSSNN